jgi:para-nitrobenzyl esterase
MRSVVVTALLTIAGCAVAVAQDVSVETDKGAVVGRGAGAVASFLGIPYAAPPVGDLRFRAPAAHAPWAAPLRAIAYGSACPQTARLGSPSSNEDCLFLNVWRPLRGGGHPVMVFIHGGSFAAGNGGAVQGGPDYSGWEIAEKSGAVVVTVNYRLGILGYLAAAGLDAETPAHVSGNYGLQDQQAALGWVHRNIAAFGGDPGNVTLFGESAGGISILYQLASPAAVGLFQRAIVESANDGSGLSLAEAEQVDLPIIKALGCDASDAGCLRRVRVETILESGYGAVPLVDGELVPQAPLEAFTSGVFNRVPVIVGTNATEGTYFLAVAAHSVKRKLTAADYDAMIDAHYDAGAAAQIKAAYPPEDYLSPGQALAAIETDSFFACPTEAVRTALSGKVPVFGYEFSQPSPVQNFPLPPAFGLDLGQAHTTELAYVFGHDGGGAPLSGDDLVLSDRMIGFWTSKASDEDRTWLGYRSDAPEVLSLGTPVAAKSGFATAHRCSLWKSLGYPQRLLTSVAVSH